MSLSKIVLFYKEFQNTIYSVKFEKCCSRCLNDANSFANKSFCKSKKVKAKSNYRGWSPSK